MAFSITGCLSNEKYEDSYQLNIVCNMLNTLGRRDGDRVEDQQVRQTHLLGKINYRGGYRIQFSHYMETAPSSFKHNISK